MTIYSRTKYGVGEASEVREPNFEHPEPPKWVRLCNSKRHEKEKGSGDNETIRYFLATNPAVGMQINRKNTQMTENEIVKKREWHELPYAEIIKSGAIRLAAGWELACAIVYCTVVTVQYNISNCGGGKMRIISIRVE